MSPTKEIPSLVQSLYGIVARLEELFPGRPFTPDGHLVGSIGEVIAAHRYGLTLLNCSSECHDAKSGCGKLVQIKATQGNKIAMRDEPSHLVVLKLIKTGYCEEIYNGPGELPWRAAGTMQRNGQRSISLSMLKKLMADVPINSRLSVMNS